jgi:Flp pilus assembly CpaE family ATPase
VTGNDLASLQSAQRVLAYLERHYVDSSKVRLIVNRFRPEGLGRNVIETALHCDVSQIIPDDPDSIHRAIVEGKPIGSGTASGKSLKELADRLSGHAQAEPAKKPSSLAGLLSMFSRSSS